MERCSLRYRRRETPGVEELCLAKGLSEAGFLVGYEVEDLTKGANVNQRLLVQRKALIVLGVLLTFVLALGALAGCGGGDGDTTLPPDLEEANNVVVRVSGTEGVAYSGDYGTIMGEPQIVDSTVGGEPTEYQVETDQDISSGVTAFFEKTEPGAGELRAEIVADDVLVSESATYAEFGSVVVDWLPPVPGGGLPPEEGDIFEEEDLQTESTIEENP